MRIFLLDARSALPFFRQITSFSDSFHYTFNYFSYTIQIGSNWYIDTGVRDLEVEFLRLILPDLMTYVAKIYDLGPYMLCKTCIT